MTPARAKIAVDVLAGVVIASVGLALAGLTWRIAGYSTIAPAAAPAQSSGVGVDIQPILALSPFGSATTAITSSAEGAMKLKAIFLAIPAEGSVALIAGADGKIIAYGLGQDVGGGIIESIEAEQIILRTPDGQRIMGFNPDTIPATAGSAPTAGASPAQKNEIVAPPPATVTPSGRTGVDAIRSLIPPSAQGREAPPPSPASPSAMLDSTNAPGRSQVLPFEAMI